MLPERSAASMPPSTRNPQALPDPPALRRLTQSLAMLDAILSPEWAYRYYSFNAHWGDGEAMASMRDGSGDEWFLLFAPGGAALKGLAHEFALARDRGLPERLRRTLPVSFAPFLQEPAFCLDQTSFCLWREPADAAWRVVPTAAGSVPSPDEDGSAELLDILDGQPTTYQEWAEGYYERAVPLAGVCAVYEHRPLDRALLELLSPGLTLADLAADAAEIGYPVSPG